MSKENCPEFFTIETVSYYKDSWNVFCQKERQHKGKHRSIVKTNNIDDFEFQEGQRNRIDEIEIAWKTKEI